MIHFDGVHTQRSGPVLRGVDLSVEASRAVLVSGDSGAGKTTMLDLALGRATATQGTVSVFGRQVARLRQSSLMRLRRTIGFVPQTLALLDDRSAVYNVGLPLEIRALSRRVVRDRAMHMLAAVDLSEVADTPVRQLSQGQRQLIALARALITEPDILLADEPSAHLDNPGRDRLVELLAAACARGCALLITCNDNKVLSLGARFGWNHVELLDGVIRVVADRAAAAIAAIADLAAPDDTPASSSNAVELMNLADMANTLPFLPGPEPDDFESYELIIESESPDAEDVPPLSLLAAASGLIK